MNKTIILSVALLMASGCCHYETQKIISQSYLRQLSFICFDFAKEKERFPGSLGELLDYDETVATLLVCPASKKPYTYLGAGLLVDGGRLVRDTDLRQAIKAEETRLFYVELEEGQTLVIYADGHLATLNKFN